MAHPSFGSGQTVLHMWLTKVTNLEFITIDVPILAFIKLVEQSSDNIDGVASALQQKWVTCGYWP
eukprot:scaffold55304_cov15-Tisochrysis_lutea.AAC.1